MGYYEAIDYTKERLEPGQRRAVVQNLHGPPSGHEPGRAEQLPERQHHAGAVPRRSARAGRRASAAGAQPASGSARPPAGGAQGRRSARPRVVQSLVRRYVTPHTVTPRAHLLSNGSMSVMVTNAGGGYTRWRDIAVTRWREDSTCDGWGSLLLRSRPRERHSSGRRGFSRAAAMPTATR